MKASVESFPIDNIPAGYMLASQSMPVRGIYPSGMAFHHPGMDINEIRLANMRELATREGSGAALARKLDMSYPLLQNYIGKTPTKRIGDKTARKAEGVFGLERGWLDREHAKETTIKAITVPAWPFTIDRARFDQLPQNEKSRIDRFIRDTIEDWENHRVTSAKRAG